MVAVVIPPLGVIDDVKRCRDPQPNIMWSSESILEELGKGIEGPKRIGTPKEDQPSQLTCIFRGSQRPNHQQKTEHGLGSDLFETKTTCFHFAKQVCVYLFFYKNIVMKCGFPCKNFKRLHVELAKDGSLMGGQLCISHTQVCDACIHNRLSSQRVVI